MSSISARRIAARDKDPPLDANRFYKAACRAHDSADLPAALTLYSTALKLDPILLPAWIGRGVAYKESRLYSNAIEDYTHALKLSDKDSITLVILSNRANVYTIIGETNQALLDHNSAISLNRYNDPVLWTNRGCTLLSLNRIDDSSDDFTKAIETDPSYALAHYNLGLVYGRKGNIRNCVDSFKRAAVLFEASKYNKEHAEDCFRQIQLFTGADPRRNDSEGGSNSGRRKKQSPEVEISPLSPVHLRGVNRTYASLIPATPIQPSPSGVNSPNSRLPFQSPGTVASDSYDSFTPVVHTTPLKTSTPNNENAARDGGNLITNESPKNTLENGNSGRGSSSAIGPNSDVTTSLSSNSLSAPIYNPSRPPSATVVSTNGHRGSGTGGGMLGFSSTPNSPLSAASSLSPDSVEPLLSNGNNNPAAVAAAAAAAAAAARKNKLPPVKPAVRIHGLQKRQASNGVASFDSPRAPMLASGAQVEMQ